MGIGLPVLILCIISGASEIIVDKDNLMTSVVLLAASLVFLASLMALLRWRIGRVSGMILITSYLAYIIWHGSSNLV